MYENFNMILSKKERKPSKNTRERYQNLPQEKNKIEIDIEIFKKMKNKD